MFYKKAVLKNFIILTRNNQAQVCNFVKTRLQNRCFHLNTLSFCYQQPVFKELALGPEIAKQFSGLKRFSTRTTKITDNKKWSFSSAIKMK